MWSVSVARLIPNDNRMFFLFLRVTAVSIHLARATLFLFRYTIDWCLFYFRGVFLRLKKKTDSFFFSPMTVSIKRKEGSNPIDRQDIDIQFPNCNAKLIIQTGQRQNKRLSVYTLTGPVTYNSVRYRSMWRIEMFSASCDWTDSKELLPKKKKHKKTSN